MSSFHNNALVGASGLGGYQIERSLRFNSADSAYLNRTPASAGNRKTWTWSCWVKRSKITSQQTLFRGGAGSTNSTYVSFYFRDVDTLYFGGWTSNFVRTTSVFRDASAWYHIVLSVDTTLSSNRIKIYVNNVEQTLTQDAGYPAQNDDLGVNQAALHTIGGNDAAGGYADYYLTEIHFIDGQALTPSSFGETDTITGVWKPKKYAGTYGTNGFYLKFADNSGTTSTTLGKDSSGNGNNWTPNNFSVTAGAGNDSMIDTPTPYADGGNGRGNYCTLNPLDVGTSGMLSNGNLDYSLGGGSNYTARATIGMSTGKWYAEWTFVSGSNSDVGIATQQAALNQYLGQNAYGWIYYNYGQKYTNGTGEAYGATYSHGDIIGIAFDADNGTLTFYKNGVSQGQAYSGLTSGPYFFAIGSNNTTGVYNFGQRAFAYTPPSGFKALNTQNLPEPSIKKPNQWFDATTYTGNGGTLAVTNSGSMQPDMLWIKSRSTAYDHALQDAVRGLNLALYPNLTSAEISAGYASANSNGFNVAGNVVNASSSTYVAWQWKESATPGFDIVTYTGNGTSGRTISHSLGVAPSMIIVRERGNVNGWYVYHTVLGASSCVYLNSTSGSVSVPIWNSTQPSSTVVTFNGGVEVNRNGGTYVAYLWSEVAGFSKFGSYTGNGSTDGPFVACNFRPRWVMIKRTDTTENWSIYDTARNTANLVGEYLLPNSSSAGATITVMDILSNGFKIRIDGTNPGVNTSGGTYLFAAFSESAFKYSLAR